MGYSSLAHLRILSHPCVSFLYGLLYDYLFSGFTDFCFISESYLSITFKTKLSATSLAPAFPSAGKPSRHSIIHTASGIFVVHRLRVSASPLVPERATNSSSGNLGFSITHVSLLTPDSSLLTLLTVPLLQS